MKYTGNITLSLHYRGQLTPRADPGTPLNKLLASKTESHFIDANLLGAYIGISFVEHIIPANEKFPSLNKISFSFDIPSPIP